MGWIGKVPFECTFKSKEEAEKRIEEYRVLPGALDDEERIDLGMAVGYLVNLELLTKIGELGIFASAEIGIHPQSWEDQSDPEACYTERTPEMNEHNRKAQEFLQLIIEARKVAGSDDVSDSQKEKIMNVLTPVKLTKVASFTFPDTTQGNAEMDETRKHYTVQGYHVEHSVETRKQPTTWLNFLSPEFETVWTLDIFAKKDKI